MGNFNNVLSNWRLYVCLCFPRHAAVSAALVSAGNQRSHETQDTEWPWSHGCCRFSPEGQELPDLSRLRPAWWPILNVKHISFIPNKISTSHSLEISLMGIYFLWKPVWSFGKFDTLRAGGALQCAVWDSYLFYVSQKEKNISSQTWTIEKHNFFIESTYFA